MCLTVNPVRLSPASRRRRSRTASAVVIGLLAGLLAALAPAVPVVSAPAASASSAYLCMGYTRCADSGYSHAGYASRSGTMYWRMYSGHNCTNYVAYRMIQAGMSPERPFSGSGNAYNWGLAMRGITDQRPAVGAVAWWNRNVPGAGSVGHVAYVEKVVSPTVIIVSQDSWGGDFSWKRIDKNDTGWPSGFIHFRDRNELQNVSRPELPDTPRVGVPIRLKVGTWKPGRNQYTYQWLANGNPIRNATSHTFTPYPNQLGKRLAVRVTAARSGFTAVQAISNATTPVAAGTLGNTGLPVIAGDPMVDETLSVSRGTYRQRVSVTRAWFANGVAIRNATGPTLVLTSRMVGKTITVRETATARGYGTSTVTSTGAGPVLQGTIETDDPPSGSGDLRRGATLTVDPGTSRPADATVAHRWLRDGVVIPGATASTYQLTADDVGHQVTARVDRTRRNYAATTSDVVFDGVVRTSSALRVGATGYARAAAVRVRLAAPGVDAPDGRVVVTVAGRNTLAMLYDGYVRVWANKLEPGLRRVTVRYQGTDVIDQSSWTGTVRVTR